MAGFMCPLSRIDGVKWFVAYISYAYETAAISRNLTLNLYTNAQCTPS